MLTVAHSKLLPANCVELFTEVLAASVSMDVILKCVCFFLCWYLKLLSYHYSDYYCCHCCD